MSKFKVGDKLQVKKGCAHVCGVYNGQLWRGKNPTHIVITNINNNGFYSYDIYSGNGKLTRCLECFKDEHLEPFVQTWEALREGDVVLYDYNECFTGDEGKRTVLARLNDVVLLSEEDDPEAVGAWYHVKYLEKDDEHRLPTTETEEKTIEINGKKFTLDEINQMVEDAK